VVLEDADDEAEFIANEIALRLEDAGDRWAQASRHAVLVRTNDQLRPIEQALRQASVPYRLVGGRSFFDRKEVLDVLAYLRVAVNPRDEEALLRIVNVPARGLGARAVKLLREAGAGRGGTWRVLEGLARSAASPGLLFAVASGERGEQDEAAEALRAELPARATEAVAGLVRVVEGVREAASARSPTLVEDLLRDVSYRAEIERTYARTETRENRWNLAREVQEAWTTWLAGSAASEPASGFLDGLALSGRDGEADSGGVTLATIHAAKGLEYPCVHVAGLEEGVLPHSKCLDDGPGLFEERRLFYVAVTRAGEELTLTRAGFRQVRKKRVETVPSRFLEELPADVHERTDLEAPASEDSVGRHLERLRAIRDQR